MPTKGADKIQRSLRKAIGHIAGDLTEKTVTQVLIIGEMYAMDKTPVDLGTLINSQYRTVQKTADGYGGAVGYLAEYAGYVHEQKGTLKGQPRTGANSAGNYWDPNAEPQWLLNAFEKYGLADIKATIKTSYTLR